ncbi:MAG TPA: hypothetical protein VF381_14515, partial [Thermoanaerobaculia bacterium]
IPAENVVVNLDLRSALKLVSSDLPCGAATCSLGTLPGRTTRTYTVVAQVISAEPQKVEPYLEVSATNDAAMGAIRAWGSVQIVQSTTDLALTITAPAVLHPGPAQWTFNVTNFGPDAGVAFFVAFLTPPGTTFSRFIGPAAIVCIPPPNGVTGWISCSGYGLFVPNATWSATVELNVSASAPSPVQMSAEVFGNDHSYDPVKANNAATVSTVLFNVANLAVVIASDTSETWEYHVVNNGPDNAQRVTFSMKVPPDVTITSMRSNTGLCDFSGCFLGDLLPHAMDTVWVSLQPTKTGIFQISASAQAANASLQTTSDLLQMRGAEGVDLSLAASVTPQILHVGDVVTFTYYVTNRGNVTANDANLDITLPQQFAFVSGSDGCDASHCSLGTIVSGDTVKATITAVANTAGFTCTDSHTSCAKSEINESDNAASQLALILPAPAGRHRAAPH